MAPGFVEASDVKRDMELVRKILTTLVDHPHGFAPLLSFEGYTDDQIGYHAYLMHDAGWVQAVNATTAECTGPYYEIVSIKNAGHDFAEAAKNDSFWEQAKKKAKEKGLEVGNMTFSVLLEFLKQQMRHQLGLS